MSRLIEVTKLSNGKYSVNPNASGGGSPFNIVVPGLNNYYGPGFFLDNKDNPLAIDNFSTFDYSVVYTIFIPGDYNDSVYRRGTNFDELIFEGTLGEDSQIDLYKNSEFVDSIAFGDKTSTEEYTIAQIIGIS